MRRILNIGSINIDYVYDVRHFVQPGETLSATDLNIFPGGKGLNQSIALARAGASVFHAGKTGSDGREMIELMKQAGVNVDRVDSSGKNTGHAIIQVDSEGENCIILFGGANSEMDRPYIDSAFSGFGKNDFLVLQNEVNEIEYMIESAVAEGLYVVFNPAPFGPEVTRYPLDLVDCFVLNEIEGNGLSGKEKPEEILDEMRSRFPKASIVLTLGSDGALYKDANTTLRHGVYDVEVVDTTAAGDTFLGYFIASLAADKTIDEALRLASIASSLAVSRKGASSSIPILDEVLSAGLKPVALITREY
ncbi:MAG: ribokinase [Synergistaceae bacterium]|jgi:ribokinase|nr:ribokinase [Synergistaceae bacterium]